MKYYLKGWNTFSFIITPKELRQALQGFCHVISTTRVPADYRESNPDDFFNKYEGLYEKLRTGYKFEWERDWAMLNVSSDFSNDLSKCDYGEVFKTSSNEGFFKTAMFKEPCAHIGVLVLYKNDDGTILTNCGYTQFPEFVVGLQMIYPRKILFYSAPLVIECEKLCDEMGHFDVYKIIQDRVKKITKPLVLNIREKAHRPNVRISADAKLDFQNFYFARHLEVSQ